MLPTVEVCLTWVVLDKPYQNADVSGAHAYTVKGPKIKCTLFTRRPSVIAAEWSSVVKLKRGVYFTT